MNHNSDEIVILLQRQIQQLQTTKSKIKTRYLFLTQKQYNQIWSQAQQSIRDCKRTIYKINKTIRRSLKNETHD